MSAHRPRKRFGQHFLHDGAVIRHIVDVCHLKHDDRVIEIGPGLGAMTNALLDQLDVLHVVELDRDLAQRLRERPEADTRLFIHEADATTFDFCALSEGLTLRVVGNLPYNVSTPLLFHLFEHATCVKDMHVMLQKEVVDRMAAGPGSKTYGRLSVMTQYHCQVLPLFDVGTGAFTPPPKVRSTVVRLLRHATPPVTVTSYPRFAQIVQAAFAQRRKTLRNALKEHLSETAIRNAGIKPEARAETLSLAEFAAPANCTDETGSRLTR